MKFDFIEINWPNGKSSKSIPGNDWLVEARKVGICIPTGCLTGNCGACEIEVNGKVIRACISNIPYSCNKELNVDFFYDPYW